MAFLVRHSGLRSGALWVGADLIGGSAPLLFLQFTTEIGCGNLAAIKATQITSSRMQERSDGSAKERAIATGFVRRFDAS